MRKRNIALSAEKQCQEGRKSKLFKEVRRMEGPWKNYFDDDSDDDWGDNFDGNDPDDND